MSERPFLSEAVEDAEFESESTIAKERSFLRRLACAFFLFGVTNNVLYVIILSAAVDIAPSTPKGLIAFVNIFPALVAKISLPLLKGRVQYAKRLYGCAVISICGMLMVAFSNTLPFRLLGIAFASFSSGKCYFTILGLLQLSTTYPTTSGGHAVGYFASGTGAAGLVGAFLWWELRSLGVRIGAGLSSILPVIIPITYSILLPSASSHEHVFSPTSGLYSNLPYTPLAAEDIPGEEEGSLTHRSSKAVSLTLAEKWLLVKPLIFKYMLPLFSVYTLEYTINQGIGPTLLYPLPNPEQHPFLSKIIHNLRDYYPLWQLTYQTTVFFSRSSISFGFPPIPARLLPLPGIIQSFILAALFYESAVGFFGPDHEGLAIFLVFVLISIEGLCGGGAYVNVFYRINQEPEPNSHNFERTRQEREFKIGSIGFADSMGILLASLFSMPMEVGLCKIQMDRGRMLCKDVRN